MVKRLKLNEKILRDVEPQEGNSYQIFDTEIRGLAAKVQPSGNRAFTLDYRFAGRQRRLTIGRWPEWSVTAARERARELRRMIDEGEDPLAAKEELREAPRVTDMIDRYIREHLPKLSPTNAGDQISMLRKMVEPAWGNRLVTDITKSDVAKFLDFVAEGRPRPCKRPPRSGRTAWARCCARCSHWPWNGNGGPTIRRRGFTGASNMRGSVSCRRRN